MNLSRAALVALALCALPSVARPQEPGAPVPGEPLRGPRIALAQAASECLDLPWADVMFATPDVRSEGGCSVVGAGELSSTGSVRWWWTLYHRAYLWRADVDPDASDRRPSPDTVRVDEVVLFAGANGGPVAAVWHDRAERDLETFSAPRADRDLFVHRRCLAGTGGCMDHPYGLGDDGSVRPLRPLYRQQILDALPLEWGTHKGIWIDVPERIARAAVYLPLDPNCCPSFRAEAALRREGDVILSDEPTITPDTTGDVWRVVPGSRFGPVGPDTSEQDLKERLGTSQVVPTDVYLAEGFCTSGTRIFPGRDWQADVAWTDSARSHPAFVRARSAGAPWRTVGGVGIGTTLRALEELQGEPLTFGGLGWDYGGGVMWAEDGGTVGLRLDIDPSSRGVLDTLARTDPRVEELYGDRPVRSDHPLLTRLTLRVVEVGMGWGAPYDERDCEQLGAGPR